MNGALVPVTGTEYYTASNLSGVIYGPGVVAELARTDLLRAYSFASAQTPTSAIDAYPNLLDNLTIIKGVCVEITFFLFFPAHQRYCSHEWSEAVHLGDSSIVTLRGVLGDVFILRPQ